MSSRNELILELEELLRLYVETLNSNQYLHFDTIDGTIGFSCQQSINKNLKMLTKRFGLEPTILIMEELILRDV